MPAEDGPRAEYQRRLGSWAARIAALDRAHLTISNLRLLAAAAGAVMLWMAFVGHSLAPAWVLAPAVAFVALVAVHARTLDRLERARRARRWYEMGLERLAERWVGTVPPDRDGLRFADGHPYARDLDLFGRGSLFALLNLATTEAGEESLARWLSAGAEISESIARQQAVGELRPMLDWREELALVGADAGVSRTGTLAAWALAGPAGLGAGAAWLFGGCAVTSVALVALAWMRPERLDLLLVWFGIEYGVAYFTQARVGRALAGIELAERDLERLVEVLTLVEREPFRAPRLHALRDRLTVRGVPASLVIGRLRRLLSVLDATRNQMFAPIAYPLLLRSLVAVGVDRWRAANGPAVARWLDAIGDAEALACLAAYAYEHPADPFAEFSADGPLLDARALAHPLIGGDVAVPNDLALGLDARALIVSGSNMSGKSTLLRAVGLNVVLAQAGAPVRAASLRLSRLTIGATIRVEDSLQAGQSRFYAEILRIRDIVSLAAGPLPLLFLLDEILHGTNSYDRRIGAGAIVRSLVEAGAIGLVTTHDLALTELARELEGAVANVHFEDRIENGRMAFDYRMRPGVVEHSNALALMRAVGLRV
ncbi:MAG: MutS-related protein [Betaproteobacteria bacterium]